MQMAREESDREDLMREATALVERIELAIGNDVITAGFRANGAPSLFFAADPVFQFNSLGQLRRAYSAGKLYKASGGKLISMLRERSSNQTTLLSHDVSDEELAVLTADLQKRLRSLRDALSENRFTIAAQVPEGSPVLERLTQILTTFDSPIRIADRPNAC
jgi:hypothetical protein